MLTNRLAARLTVFTVAALALTTTINQAAVLTLDEACEDVGGPATPDWSDPLHSWKESVFDADSADARAAAVTAMETVLTHGSFAPDVLADGLNFIGHQHYRAGAFDAALGAFQQLSQTDGDAGLDAQRMVGQIQYLVQGDRAAAEESYLRVSGSAADSVMATALRQDALMKLSWIYSETGRPSLAMTARLQALDIAAQLGDTSELASAALAMARDAMALGMNADAQGWYADASSRYRSQGDDASVLAVELEAVKSLNRDAAIERLAAVWQDPKPGHAGYFVASHKLAGLLMDNGEDAAAMDVLRLVDAALVDGVAGFDGIDADTVALIHEDALLTLVIDRVDAGDVAGGDAYLARAQQLYKDSPRQAQLFAHYPNLGARK